ncbi:response regulator transcription factor [Streptomyces sp. NPDC020096]
MITVLSADDDPAMRQTLRAVIDTADDLGVVAEAQDERSALKQARRLLPDLVVMDIHMPGVNGVEPAQPAPAVLTARHLRVRHLRRAGPQRRCEAIFPGRSPGAADQAPARLGRRPRRTSTPPSPATSSTS